jgi:hypothetical protein
MHNSSTISGSGTSNNINNYGQGCNGTDRTSNKSTILSSNNSNYNKESSFVLPKRGDSGYGAEKSKNYDPCNGMASGYSSNENGISLKDTNRSYIK